MIYIQDHALWWDEGEDLQSRKSSQNYNGAESLSCFKHIWIKQIKVIIEIHELKVDKIKTFFK
jgi:hypothetical protein